MIKVRGLLAAVHFLDRVFVVVAGVVIASLCWLFQCGGEDRGFVFFSAASYIPARTLDVTRFRDLLAAVHFLESFLWLGESSLRVCAGCFNVEEEIEVLIFVLDVCFFFLFFSFFFCWTFLDVLL